MKQIFANDKWKSRDVVVGLGESRSAEIPGDCPLGPSCHGYVK